MCVFDERVSGGLSNCVFEDEDKEEKYWEGRSVLYSKGNVLSQVVVWLWIVCHLKRLEPSS